MDQDSRTLIAATHVMATHTCMMQNSSVSMLTPLESARRWRQLAEEMRVISQYMQDPAAKLKMLRIAENYEFMAERAEQRARGQLASCTR